MKTIWLSVVAAAMLCGCPDSRVPKKPPTVPEPKLTEPAARQSTVPVIFQIIVMHTA